jgi:hypothetical protein
VGSDVGVWTYQMIMDISMCISMPANSAVALAASADLLRMRCRLARGWGRAELTPEPREQAYRS